jgi:hypothetical protein
MFKVGDRVTVVALHLVDGSPCIFGEVDYLPINGTIIGEGCAWRWKVENEKDTLVWLADDFELRKIDPQMFIQFSEEHV